MSEDHSKVTMEDLGFPSGKCYVIAEVAQAHDGSLGMAHAYIDAVADAGANAVKFQTHIAAAESTRDEPWRIKFSRQDESRYDYWRRMEFDYEQWKDLAGHAVERGLEFMSSPFSVAAVEMLEDLGMQRWKVASGEVNNPELLSAIWSTRKPVLFSSGMSVLADLESAVVGTQERGIPYGIFQCISRYPCPPAAWGLKAIAELSERFRCPVGYSDHSGVIFAGLAAAAMEAQFLEIHVTFSKQMFGPDVPASITISELEQLVSGANMIYTAIRSMNEKDQLSAQTSDLKAIFGRSLALRRDEPAGTVLTEAHLTLKKPGSGIPYDNMHLVLGRRLRIDKKSDRLLMLEDLE